jgi:hypothetical protein
MGIFSNLFNKSTEVDEKIENIQLLKVTSKKSEAKNKTSELIYELRSNPSLINSVKDYGKLGNFLTNELNSFNRNDELQFISEMSFFASSKSLIKKVDPFILYDRLIILYNAEDFITETILAMNGNHSSSISLGRFANHSKWIADDILIKMRFHDLFYENKFHSNGGNDNSFNGQEFIDLSYRIKNGSFESKNPEEIVNLGKIEIEKCYNHIANKYQFSK